MVTMVLSIWANGHCGPGRVTDGDCGPGCVTNGHCGPERVTDGHGRVGQWSLWSWACD